MARHVLVVAEGAEADIPRLIVRLHGLRPNRKSLDRSVCSLRSTRGVVRAALTAEGNGVVVLARNLRNMVTRAADTDIFTETALVYTRIEAAAHRGGVHYRLWRASFCRHALERLVQRSAVPLDASLLSTVDGEAVSLLRRLARGQILADADDKAICARQDGIWAGSLDISQVEDDWGLVGATNEANLPVFSVRTFLGPNEMCPTVWLRWKETCDAMV